MSLWQGVLVEAAGFQFVYCVLKVDRISYVRGSKSKGTGMLHVAIALDAFLIVLSEILIYLRKQSLDQRPML